jgi:hypothetical protein
MKDTNTSPTAHACPTIIASFGDLPGSYLSHLSMIEGVRAAGPSCEKYGNAVPTLNAEISVFSFWYASSPGQQVQQGQQREAPIDPHCDIRSSTNRARHPSTRMRLHQLHW